MEALRAALRKTKKTNTVAAVKKTVKAKPATDKYKLELAKCKADAALVAKTAKQTIKEKEKEITEIKKAAVILIKQKEKAAKTTLKAKDKEVSETKKTARSLVKLKVKRKTTPTPAAVPPTPAPAPTPMPTTTPAPGYMA